MDTQYRTDAQIHLIQLLVICLREAKASSKSGYSLLLNFSHSPYHKYEGRVQIRQPESERVTGDYSFPVGVYDPE